MAMNEKNGPKRIDSSFNAISISPLLLSLLSLIIL